MSLVRCPSPFARRGTFRHCRNRVRHRCARCNIKPQRTRRQAQSSKGQSVQTPFNPCVPCAVLLNGFMGCLTSPYRCATSLSFVRRGTFWQRQNRVRYFLRVLCEKTLRTFAHFVVKRERNHEEHEGNTRSSQSIRAKSFNLCSPCAIEERHTDETDSTDKHSNSKL